MLLGVGFIPWPTSVVADYIGDGGVNASIATALYSLTMTLIGIVFVAMWAHLVRHPEHTIESVTEAQLRRSMRLALVSPIVYAATIASRVRQPVHLSRGVRDARRVLRRGARRPVRWSPTRAHRPDRDDDARSADPLGY